MKQDIILIRISFLFTMVVLSGCVKSGNIISTQPQNNYPSSINSSTSTINLPTEIIKNFVTEDTSSPAISTLTPTSISTIYRGTVTPTPNLSPENARIRLLELLKNNGNCRLPCIWGITPGISTFQDAQNILEPLRDISDFTAFSKNVGNISPFLIEDKTKININFDFLANSGLIKQIRFKIGASQEENGGEITEIYNSDVFGKIAENYMLPQILGQYGQPSEIRIKTFSEPPLQSRGGDTGDFNIILLYPEKGILINYNTIIQIKNNYITGCLSDAHITINLYPSSDNNSFWENLDGSLKSDLQGNYKSIEEVTSLSINDFYQIYSKNTDTCIETPANLWPKPEN